MEGGGLISNVQYTTAIHDTVKVFICGDLQYTTATHDTVKVFIFGDYKFLFKMS